MILTNSVQPCLYKISSNAPRYQIKFSGTSQYIMGEAEKTTGLLRKLQAILPNFSLVAFYKAFKRSHLNNRDIIYDQVHNESFHQKLFQQYNIMLH